MSAAHTPGPWVAKQEFANRWRIEFLREGRLPLSVGLACTTVLEFGVGADETTAANARLIAAAPDLLEACVQLRAFLETIAYNTSDMDALDAAIAKATGAA